MLGHRTCAFFNVSRYGEDVWKCCLVLACECRSNSKRNIRSVLQTTPSNHSPTGMGLCAKEVLTCEDSSSQLDFVVRTQSVLTFLLRAQSFSPNVEYCFLGTKEAIAQQPRQLCRPRRRCGSCRWRCCCCVVLQIIKSAATMIISAAAWTKRANWAHRLDASWLTIKI